MGIIIEFRKDDLSPDDVLRYFFHEINEAHGLSLSLTDPRLSKHLTALKSLANVYIHTANPGVQGVTTELNNSLSKELNKLRARFLAETVLGILVEEGIVRLKAD